MKKPYHEISKSTFVTHGIWGCYDCEREGSSQFNAQATASQHARIYKHRTYAEIGITSLYDPKELEKPEVA